MSLATRLIASTVFLFAIVIASSAYYGLRTVDDLARANANARRADGEIAMTNQAELLARNLAISVGLPLAEGNYTYVQSLAETARESDPRVEWVSIADAESGLIVARTEGAPSGSQFDDGLTEQLRAGASTAVLHTRDEQDPTSWVFGAKALAGTQIVGSMRIGVTTREMEEVVARSIEQARTTARASARKQLFFAGALLVVAILMVAIQALRITRPLHELSVQAERIAAGDFDRRVAVTSRDEIGRLGHDFNVMAESLGVLVRERADKALLDRELEIARSVQELMSPPTLPVRISGAEIAGYCETATVCGGDWWSYRALSDGRVLLLVGDVTGHGVGSAMIAATARGAVESLAMARNETITPKGVLEAIDSAIRDVGRKELFMTCFAIVFDPRRGTMDYANAGHVSPYVAALGSDGRFGELDIVTALSDPLGSDPAHYATGSRRLKRHDVLVLTTDGVTDRVAPDGDRFAEKRLRRVLKDYHAGDTFGAAVLRDAILSAVRQFSAGAPSDDDLTLVILHYDGATSTSTQARVNESTPAPG